MKADRAPRVQQWTPRISSLSIPRRRISLVKPPWCRPTNLRTLASQSEAEQWRAARSARERLQANPAYQRLKTSSWKDSYKPTDAGNEPGPVPKHLLEEPGPSAPWQEQQYQGAVPGQWQPTQQSRQHSSMRRPPDAREQPQPSTSGYGSEQTQLAQTGDDRKSDRQGLQRNLGQPNRNARTSRVRFWLHFHAEFGQRMWLVGSHEAIGGWILSEGVELKWSTNDQWNTVVELPAGTIVEYKYVLLQSDGARALAWQRGNNSVLAVGHSDDEVEVFDNWESSPGASVVAGGATTTREGRLLSWASEIETLFASQRQELRQSRMELVAAQDEARVAREEARKVRAELHSSEAIRFEAELKVKELSTANRFLRSELAETTLSFRTALETTHRFLLEAQQALMSKQDSREEEEEEGGESSALDVPAETASAFSALDDLLHEVSPGNGPVASTYSNGAGKPPSLAAEEDAGGYDSASEYSSDEEAEITAAPSSTGRAAAAPPAKQRKPRAKRAVDPAVAEAKAAARAAKAAARAAKKPVRKRAPRASAASQNGSAPQKRSARKPADASQNGSSTDTRTEPDSVASRVAFEAAGEGERSARPAAVPAHRETESENINQWW